MMGLLAICADASANIGNGHVMRCLALAQAWQGHGGRVVFIGRIETNSITERLQKENIEFITLQDNASDEKALSATLHELEGLAKSNLGEMWVVLDGYHFGIVFQGLVRAKGFRLLILDDSNHFTQYNADILVNLNFNAEQLAYNAPSETRLLLGVKYALLRREFLKYSSPRKGVKEEKSLNNLNILVSLGGADPFNQTELIIKSLSSFSLPSFSTKIVVGSANCRITQYSKQVKNISGNVELISDALNMPELLAWADLAIISAGGTIWECFYMGCPIVSTAINETQHNILTALERENRLIYLGLIKNISKNHIINTLDKFFSDKNLFLELTKKNKRLIDGHGGERVMKEIYRVETMQ